jgi:5-methyltetrahydropteroyltriglutamate--homocysteine methyltransferase
MLETEPIGSIPRPPALIDGMGAFARGDITQEQMDELFTDALRDTIDRFELTGSPVVTDGEQTKSSFVTYPLDGLKTIGPGGAVIPFADGHTRQLPQLTSGPFRYSQYAEAFLTRAQGLTSLPLKQSVIAVSAMSLLYPADGVDGYDKEQFLADLVAEGVKDIRGCLDAGARRVQIDFTEGRLALKLDPSGGLLESFVALNNQVLAQFSDAERARIGVHTCPGGDQDSTHSADVEYGSLLPQLFAINAGSFFLQMASEADREKVLGTVRDTVPADAKVFIGVIDPINPRVETPEEVRDQILQAAEHIPVDQLGSCDDCGFSPFGDDVSTSRDIAFDKIRNRVEGTRLASDSLGV